MNWKHKEEAVFSSFLLHRLNIFLTLPPYHSTTILPPLCTHNNTLIAFYFLSLLSVLPESSNPDPDLGEEGSLLKSSMEPLPESHLGRDDSPTGSPRASKHIIDTAVPFESVKDAVSKFGGRVDWRSRRTQSLVEERSRFAGEDFGKAETAEELENTKKLIAELKMNLQSVEKDEVEVKEEAERVILKIEELEQDIVGEASIEAKTQLEVEKSMHTEALSELELMKKEVDALRKEYASMVSGRDTAINNAEETVAASKQIEKAVEDLTAELVATKEALKSTRAAYLQAEEQRSGVVDEESHNLKLELEQAEEELQRLNEQVLSARVLKSKLESASSLLHDLKAELAAYMESKVKEECYEDLKAELEELKVNIEKATSDVSTLREASNSLKSKLEEEKSVLSSLKQSEEKASAAVANLQVELEKSRSAEVFYQMKESEQREVMSELPKKLQKAAQEADEAKSLAQAAQEELVEAQQEVEQAKARSTTLETSLMAAQKEIEAAKVAEMLARDAITALEKSESAKGNNEKDSSSLVTLTLDEYHELSRRAYKAEEQANVRMEAANSQVQIARESELRSLEKLEELDEELTVRKESLKIVTGNAEKASDGKIAVEQELRTWMDEQEEQKKASEFSHEITPEPEPEPVPEPEPEHEPLSPKEKHPSNNPETGSASAKTKKKKKKSLFPSKVVMFFAKKKTHPTK
ncbi:protein WEAK CHLOROPLAST MOVEMENT UNDER BLUE LIGHT 1 isoform X2 [Cajanus cajan]|uniref:protein WEAK CHLOROPLAST MOVEMENT UNDER BLUE LIGHT 1 isoform X2 n=1 Tax=Cajanus cajan TaxID=3821 RepID=UPI00098D7B8E|nr:protein WEAK CHLOROPLAST MOVEMENT UNDER BLUE LIGHT 1 isoform X2 [Cajanus cajan]